MTTAPLLHRPTFLSTGRPSEPPSSLIDEPSVRLGLAGFALFAATAVVAVIAPPDTLGTIALLSVSALLSVGLAPTGACLMGAAAWGFVEGFVLHDGGQLTLGPRDLWLLVAAVLVCLVPGVLAATRSGVRGGER